MQVFLYLCNMKHPLLTLLLCLLPSLVWGETVVLKSGKTLSGQILVQNEEVLIIRDSSGARYQFPMQDIKSITSSAATSTEKTVEASEEAQKATSSAEKKAALSIEVSGGGLYIDSQSQGGFAAADLIIGTRQLLGKSILLGGSIGYIGAFSRKNRYNILPICLSMRVPLLEGKHAPMIGANIGYGVALSKAYLGGIHAGADVAYRYTMKNKSSLSIGLNVRFQQLTTPVTDTIRFDEGTTDSFTHNAGRNIVAYGVKLGFIF